VVVNLATEAESYGAPEKILVKFLECAGLIPEQNSNGFDRSRDATVFFVVPRDA